MTNFQKAFCVVLSMCFFATLAMLPGALFTGENVYRHLPLYRFLEKKTQVHSYEDQETYEKIAGENGKYLGERAKSEQMEAKEEANSLMTEESQNPSEAEKETDALTKRIRSQTIRNQIKKINQQKLRLYQKIQPHLTRNQSQSQKSLQRFRRQQCQTKRIYRGKIYQRKM